ncbi:CAAX amino protease [Philodulcilactobacillus myokoensis]|uniref:CAAX amino protease n=1 Tax=Philodulcilactobacillus myokoensis TaxID=2929573 RepID=A0A9W6EUR6_9LACO|nr:type II CAAX endopeptidase family protein [Philodulcilactobacillus myokoensis]GLB47544.1 CAAX amino protease [Philodulcilactobacillus myokoensis]
MLLIFKNFSERLGQSTKFLLHVIVVIAITLIYSMNLAPTVIAVYKHYSILKSVLYVGFTFLILFGSFAAIYFAYKAWGRNHIGKLTKSQLKFSIKVWIVVFIINIVLSILDNVVYHTQTTANQSILNGIASNSDKVVLIFFILDLLLSPFVEEFIFRGFIMDVFFKENSFWMPIIVSSVFFALGHATGGDIFAFLTYFSMGAGLGYIYKKTGNIKASISMHFLQNALASLAMLLLLF